MSQYCVLPFNCICYFDYLIVSCVQIHDRPENVGAFLDRYIFPGGYLPSINQLLTSIHTGSGGSLEVECVQSIGPHYIKTLQCWRENFLRNWDFIRSSFVAKHAGLTEEEIEFFRRRWIVSDFLPVLLDPPSYSAMKSEADPGIDH